MTRGGHRRFRLLGRRNSGPSAGPAAYSGLSPSASNCRLHSVGGSRSRSTPMPRGRRPSIAALTRLGARKASEMVILTCRTLHFSRVLAEFDPIAYIHPCLLLDRGTDEQLNRMADVSRSAKTFTPKQGQYLAFIHLYTRLHRRPPAETDMQEYFRVSPPSVHQMVLTLERAGLIRTKPRTPRSIELLVDPNQLPELL